MQEVKTRLITKMSLKEFACFPAEKQSLFQVLAAPKT